MHGKPRDSRRFEQPMAGPDTPDIGEPLTAELPAAAERVPVVVAQRVVATRTPVPGVAAPRAVRARVPARRSVDLPSVHAALVCVAMPAMVISAGHGQLEGRGLEGFYHAGRRLLARCRLRIAGREPLAVQGRSTAADRARFVGTVRTAADLGPDPAVVVERVRWATGFEWITLSSSATRTLRLQVEVELGTDLAEIGAIVTSGHGPALAAAVYESGLRWRAGAVQSVVAASPAPDAVVASAGLLRWEVELPPGGSRGIELRVGPGRPPVRGARRVPAPWSPAAAAAGDDERAPMLLAGALDDLGALLLRDPAHPADAYPAAGVPWRCGLAPAEALAAVRMLLPLGTRLAAGTLRALVRAMPGAGGCGGGLFPGGLRYAGPWLPPRCTGLEATLLFPVVLAEARLWGLTDADAEPLLPVAERCLERMRVLAGERGFVPDPAPGGPYRCETQAHAHRAAELGAGLLAEFGRPGAAELREWAAGLRARFRKAFWADDRSGGRPVAALAADGRAVPYLGGAAAHLLDAGLASGGEHAPALLDRVQTEQLARLLGGPALDSGWGLRSLGAREPAYNPFGHCAGAVQVQESAVAVGGLFAAGYEKEGGGLLRGVLDAGVHFGFRLPEMYAGERRTRGGAPVPHPAACRPAAVAAAAVVHLLTAVAGIRPDAPGGTVVVRPVGTAPLGALQLTGWRVAEQPFAVRVGRLGMAMVEEAGEELQLGV